MVNDINADAFNEELKEFRGAELLTITENGQTQHHIEAFFTFINPTGASGFYVGKVNTFTTLDNANRIHFAQIDLLSNNHHWEDDRIQPDIILAQTILGDPDEIIDS